MMMNGIIVFGRIVTIVVLLIAVIVGLFMNGALTKLGLFRIMAEKWHSNHQLIGFTPAHMYGVPWAYDYDIFTRNVVLTGQYGIITGANSGIGYAATYHLVKQGAHITMACRSRKKCMKSKESIERSISSSNPFGGSLHCMDLDTSSFASVRAFVDKYEQTYSNIDGIDMLLLNAGIAPNLQDDMETSEDGIELVFQTNHVGHQLLYELLLDKLLKSSNPSRVVVTSSLAHYDASGAGVALTKDDLFKQERYAQSKLANLLFAQEATRRLSNLVIGGNMKGLNVYVNSFNPGIVNTNIFEGMKSAFPAIFGSWFGNHLSSILSEAQRWGWTPDEGALTMVFLAASPNVTSGDGIRGKYYHPQAFEVTPNQVYSNNITLQTELWSFTQSLYL